MNVNVNLVRVGAIVQFIALWAFRGVLLYQLMLVASYLAVALPALHSDILLLVQSVRGHV